MLRTYPISVYVYGLVQRMPNPRKRQRKDTPPDFQKKKAKVGKGKQSAENVTQLNFKSGSIVVPSQLADSSIHEPTTHRKLGFQTLLTQLKHHNPSTRVSALHGLRDLLQSNPDLLPSNLAKLVEQVMVAVVDQSAQVRQALSTLLSLIVSKTPVKKLAPFSSLIIAHLSCGLTHIDERIQLDTLKALDVYVAKPSFVAPHVHTLLPLLVKLISRQKTSSSGESSKSSLLGVFRGLFSKQKGASLVSVPDSKLTDYSSRQQIFQLLLKLLEALLGSTEAEGSDSMKETASVGTIIDIVNRCVSIPDQTCVSLVSFSSPIPHVPLFRSSGLHLPVDRFALKMVSADSVTNSLDASSWSELIPSLLSLLLESWIDCSPKSVSSSSRASKKSSLMEVVLRLILTTLHLATLIQSNPAARSLESISSLGGAFSKFWNEFQTHFLSTFPLATQPSLSGSGSFKTDLDLQLCLLSKELLEITPSISSQNKKAVLTGISDFFSLFSSLKVSSSSELNTQEFQTCVRVLVEVYPFLVSTKHTTEVITCERLSGVTQTLWKLYTWSHPLSKSKQFLHKCFGKLLKSSKIRRDLRLMVMAELLLPWLQSIPDLLHECEDVSTVTLLLRSLMGCVECVGSVEVAGELEKIVTAIFSHTSILQQLPPNTQRLCVALVWQIPVQPFFQSKGLVSITQAIQHGTLDSDVAVYMVQTVHHKVSYQCSVGAQPLTVGHYLSFMLSLVIGQSCEEFRNCSSLNLVSRFTPPLFSVVRSERPLHQLYHNKVTKVVCECLRASSFASEALHLMEGTLLGLSEISSCLPVETVASLLTLGVSLVPLTVPVISEHLSLFFARLCISLLITMETTPELKTHYPKLTNQTLESSKMILNSLLMEIPQQLSKEQQNGCWSNVTAVLKALVSLVSSKLAHGSEAAVRSVKSVVGLVGVEKVVGETGGLIAQLRIMHTNLAMYSTV